MKGLTVEDARAYVAKSGRSKTTVYRQADEVEFGVEAGQFLTK